MSTIVATAPRRLSHGRRTHLLGDGNRIVGQVVITERPVAAHPFTVLGSDPVRTVAELDVWGPTSSVGGRRFVADTDDDALAAAIAGAEAFLAGGA